MYKHEKYKKIYNIVISLQNSSPVLETRRNIKVNDAAKKKKPNMGHIERWVILM